MFLFALLFFVCAFDAGQSKPAFPNQNDSEKVAVDLYRGSDFSEAGGSQILDYNAADADEPAEADDGLVEVEFVPDESKTKRWVPTEVSVDQVMQKVLLSRLVNNKDRQGKRQSGSIRPSTGGDGTATDEGPFPPVPQHRRFSEDRHFTGIQRPEPNRLAYESEADAGNAESLSDVEHRPSHLIMWTSLAGKQPFAQKHKGGISIWKMPQRSTTNEEKQHLRDIFILSDYLDRQGARKTSRQSALHRLNNKQERQNENDQAEWLRLHPELYDLTLGTKA